MNSKLKNIIIPFVLMMIFNLGINYMLNLENFGLSITPHVGIIFISGLFFGPLGALSATIANFICDIARSYSIGISIFSAIITFSIALLPYKLWYEKLFKSDKILKPGFDDTHHLIKLLIIIILCGLLYSLLTDTITYIFYPRIEENFYVYEGYFLNFINFSSIYTIIILWISEKIDFIETPQKSDKKKNMLYPIVFILIIILTAVNLITTILIDLDYMAYIIITIITALLLFVYLTKPNYYEISKIRYENPISENIIKYFLLISLVIIIFGLSITIDKNVSFMELINADITLLIFFIPSLLLLRNIEKNVVTPIIEFSEIKDFIKENEKIESESLIEIYSKYADYDNEIGSLARSYTNLIKNNNEYIENIREIEGEKKRIETELDIAKKIQQSNLPTHAIDNEFFYVNGFNYPAKEVGGDFFDFYEIDDEHLVIVIGDASGKGVPAALLATTTQAIIKQLVNTTDDPSEILYALNNQLCATNEISMFITLWLGIYNKKTKNIVFSNAGHNPPVIKENEEYQLLEENTGLVLGIMEDFEFVREERILQDGIILYTDGITDANNENDEMYGENRLIEFFSDTSFNENITTRLLSNLKAFIGTCEQFDDMTLLILKVKK